MIVHRYFLYVMSRCFSELNNEHYPCDPITRFVEQHAQNTLQSKHACQCQSQLLTGRNCDILCSISNFFVLHNNSRRCPALCACSSCQWDTFSQHRKSEVVFWVVRRQVLVLVNCIQKSKVPVPIQRTQNVKKIKNTNGKLFFLKSGTEPGLGSPNLGRGIFVPQGGRKPYRHESRPKVWVKHPSQTHRPVAEGRRDAACGIQHWLWVRLQKNTFFVLFCFSGHDNRLTT